MSSARPTTEDDLDDLPPRARPDGKYMCQRLGCDALYVPGPLNAPGSCVHHVARPSFRDGVKRWPCCGKSSHDFGEFMSIKGCAVGAHTCVKITYEDDADERSTAPLVTQAPIAPMRAPIGRADAQGAVACARCAAGYYCAEHAANAVVASAPEEKRTIEKSVVDIGAWQTCKRPGCGSKFRERDNADDACKHHAGAPIFHETKKGWSCCTADKLVYDFDDFLKIPPCAVGRHDANAAPLTFQRSAPKK